MKKLEVMWEEDALNDRDDIYGYLSSFSLQAADRTEEQIEIAAQLLVSQPEMAVEIDASTKVRKWLISSTELNIYYVINDHSSQLIILRVLHSQQRIPRFDH